MKRLALAAVVLSFAACSAQDDAPLADSTATAPAMAPAPAAPVDSTMMDSTMMDTTAADTTMTPPPAQ